MNQPRTVGKRLDFTIGETHAAGLPASEADPAQSPSAAGASTGKPFIGILFQCCGVYSRVFLNRAGDAYQGNCPRCSSPVRFVIGPGGSDARFFEVY